LLRHHESNLLPQNAEKAFQKRKKERIESTEAKNLFRKEGLPEEEETQPFPIPSLLLSYESLASLSKALP